MTKDLFLPCRVPSPQEIKEFLLEQSLLLTALMWLLINAPTLNPHPAVNDWVEIVLGIYPCSCQILSAAPISLAVTVIRLTHYLLSYKKQ